MDFLIKFVGAMILLSVFVLPHRWAQLWCWLKGSRITYYLPRSRNSVEIQTTTNKIRTRKCSGLGNNPEGAVIEVNRGFFRKRSKVYNSGVNVEPVVYWQVAQNWKNSNGDIICLQDKGGLPIETALRTINKYQSFQAMLDRIAELEKELSIANNRRTEWLAATSALYLEITTDRQKYRSPAAGHIRECIDVIIEWANQDKNRFSIEPKLVMAWKDRFPHHS